MTHPVTLVVRSMRENPDDWLVTHYEATHKSGVYVWIANSYYGMEIKGAGAHFGGVTFLSCFGLSFRHWQLYFATRKLRNRKMATLFAGEQS